VRFEKLYRALTANLGLKIISLLVALLLWLYVTAQQAQMQGFKVPLELENIPDSLTVMQEVPPAVDVTVSGTKSDLLKLRFFSKMRAVVDCSAQKRGTVSMPLSAANLRIPRDVRPGEVSIESPRSLVLTFEPVVRRYVPVQAAFAGELGKDLTFAAPPVIVPDRVLVSGASSAVAGVSSVSTEEIALPVKPGKISREVAISLGGRRAAAVPPKVLVEVEVSRRAVRTFESVTPTVLQADEDLTVEYAPRVASVTVEGPEDLVKNLQPDEVSIVLNITMRKPGSYRVRPDVIVPQGIEKYSLDIEAFDVTLAPKGHGGG
jgi:YbbR domain-containing protein